MVDSLARPRCFERGAWCCGACRPRTHRPGKDGTCHWPRFHLVIGKWGEYFDNAQIMDSNTANVAASRCSKADSVSVGSSDQQATLVIRCAECYAVRPQLRPLSALAGAMRGAQIIWPWRQKVWGACHPTGPTLPRSNRCDNSEFRSARR
ncbi:hypothetical protein BDV95DRAFT_183885 [Massariosphaeria phaeospora]|uniref:Uncharacterized protein n=1 Tax=Massariosphaeria phaeospora TaxID=100035 RepID=A0A7C8I7F8_9PLEO|nr:hypothetical protein BDV95DRAFT_183885 [Massariosphaeria phaeospora]